MNWLVCSPRTCGPSTTPSSNSITTTGTSTPRPATIPASVPASADAATIARNVPGATWITATATALTPRPQPLAPIADRLCPHRCFAWHASHGSAVCGEDRKGAPRSGLMARKRRSSELMIRVVLHLLVSITSAVHKPELNHTAARAALIRLHTRCGFDLCPSLPVASLHSSYHLLHASLGLPVWSTWKTQEACPTT
jgi:hypothetical protein